MKAINLKGLDFATTRKNGVSYGCYYKVSVMEHGEKYYYKCSNFYSGSATFGDESVYEVICSRLAQMLGISCAMYTLVYGEVTIKGYDYITYLCKSQNFAKGCDSRITLEQLATVLGCRNWQEVVQQCNIVDDISQMIVFDFLTIQRDRHGDNIELLRKDGQYVLAPLFDNGLSFLAPYASCFDNKERIQHFDVMADYPVNNYIGSQSLYQNLKLLQKPVSVKVLSCDSEMRKHLFYGLRKTLPVEYLNIIWTIICERYKFLRNRGYIHET